MKTIILRYSETPRWAYGLVYILRETLPGSQLVEAVEKAYPETLDGSPLIMVVPSYLDDTESVKRMKSSPVVEFWVDSDDQVQNLTQVMAEFYQEDPILPEKLVNFWEEF